MFLRHKRVVARLFRDRLLDYSPLAFIAICLMVFLLIKGFWIMEKNLRPAILSIAQVKANMLAIDAVNRAIVEEVTHGISYQDLISIKQDETGKITMAQINTMEINRLMAKTTLTTQNFGANRKRTDKNTPRRDFQ